MSRNSILFAGGDCSTPCAQPRYLAHLTPKGKLDVRFGTGGVAPVPVFGVGAEALNASVAFARQTRKTIVIAGNDATNGNDVNFFVARMIAPTRPGSGGS